jgi:acetyltransferase-like isoleucine patch superfamily enzyme
MKTEKEKMLAVSLVTKNIPPDVFAAGNPCKVIRLL